MVQISELGGHVGETVTLRGWVDTTRSHGKVAFVVLRDGTGTAQCVLVKKKVEESTWDLHETLTQESTVAITGEVRADDRAPGGCELGITEMSLIALADEYPIQPKGHGVDFLLDHRHLWLRSSLQRAGLKVRAEVEQAVHDFFYRRDFVRIDTPILTGSIGEHAGTLFSTDYFGEQAYLAQTGQLYAEAAAAAFGKVYCFGPTFRAEKSKTRRHLTEFWMIEPEVAFADSEDNMRLQEDFVSYLVERALENCKEELEILERDTSKLEHVKPPFPRVSYTDAVAALQAKGMDVEWGTDLGAPDEQAITEDYDLPVFVYNYPKQAKAFYMKENPEDTRTVLCDDLLAPEGYGEMKLPEEAYSWYLDLRRYGTFPHSGFGLGLERTVAWITGRHHIRELIPFPRLMNRLFP
jgi:asparaginyl-tRNA synthetase